MEDEVRRDIAKLFSGGEISLHSLETERKLPEKFSLLEKKCEHLAASIECNVGGFGSFKCVDENFHAKCPFKRRHYERIVNRSGLVNISEIKWNK